MVRLDDVTHGQVLRVWPARLRRLVFPSSDIRPNELRLDHRHRVTLQMPTPFDSADRKCFDDLIVDHQRCLSFFDAESVEEVATIDLRADVRHDMAIAHDRVYLAGGRHGLGVIDLHGSRNVIERPPYDAVLSSDDPRARSSLALELVGALQCRTFDENVGGDLKLGECLNAKQAVLAIREQGGQSHPRILNCAG